jgi:hypothetical protein
MNPPPFTFNPWPTLGWMFLRACGVHDEEELEKWSLTVGMILFFIFLLLITVLVNLFRN